MKKRKEKKDLLSSPSAATAHSKPCRIGHPSSESLGSTEPPFLATKWQPSLGGNKTTVCKDRDMW